MRPVCYLLDHLLFRPRRLIMNTSVLCLMLSKGFLLLCILKQAKVSGRDMLTFLHCGLVQAFISTRKNIKMISKRHEFFSACLDYVSVEQTVNNSHSERHSICIKEEICDTRRKKIRTYNCMRFQVHAETQQTSTLMFLHVYRNWPHRRHLIAGCSAEKLIKITFAEYTNYDHVTLCPKVAGSHIFPLTKNVFLNASSTKEVWTIRHKLV